MNKRGTHDNPDSSAAGTPSRSLKLLVLLCVAGMLVPVIPFLIAGPFLEQWLVEAVAQLSSPAVILAAAFLMLASDIFLPVPSSAVITYAGAHCGFLPAVVASAAGLTVGCLLGYELARRYGTKLLQRYASAADAERLQERAERGGGLIVVATRPLPILGETAVLIVGCLQLRRQVFYTAATAANFAVAIVYVQFGRLAREQDSLVIPIVISLLAPLALTFAVRKFLHRRERLAQRDVTPDRD